MARARQLAEIAEAARQLRARYGRVPLHHAVSRMYYAVILADGTFLTIYHDLVGDAGFEQRS